MYNPDTDLIFPPRGISPLCNERGAQWQELVAAVEKTGLDSPEQMAFILMMARLNNCATCNSDSYRAINGCIVCAKQSLKRFHGSDEELKGLFETARAEVSLFLQNKYASEQYK
jgi:alkylhydroperoxidase family enzyme